MPLAHSPQSSAPPQPLPMRPQYCPPVAGEHETGVQSALPQTLSSPPPPQVFPSVHCPHSSTPPQPSPIVPQKLPPANAQPSGTQPARDAHAVPAFLAVGARAAIERAPATVTDAAAVAAVREIAAQRLAARTADADVRFARPVARAQAAVERAAAVVADLSAVRAAGGHARDALARPAGSVRAARAALRDDPARAADADRARGAPLARAGATTAAVVGSARISRSRARAARPEPDRQCQKTQRHAVFGKLHRRLSSCGAFLGRSGPRPRCFMPLGAPPIMSGDVGDASARLSAPEDALEPRSRAPDDNCVIAQRTACMEPPVGSVKRSNVVPALFALLACSSPRADFTHDGPGPNGRQPAGASTGGTSAGTSGSGAVTTGGAAGSPGASGGTNASGAGSGGAGAGTAGFAGAGGSGAGGTRAARRARQELQARERAPSRSRHPSPRPKISPRRAWCPASSTAA